MKCLASRLCLPVPQGKAPGRQFLPVWELLLFQTPTPGPGKLNKCVEHQRPSANVEFAPRFSEAQPASLGSLQAQEPSLHLGPALLGLQRPSLFPSCGPSQAYVPAPPLSLDASLGPIITRRQALPPTPLFSSLLPSLPSSLSPSLPAPAPGNGPDPGSGLTREIPNLASGRGWRQVEGGGGGGAGPLGCSGGSQDWRWCRQEALGPGFPGRTVIKHGFGHTAGRALGAGARSWEVQPQPVSAQTLIPGFRLYSDILLSFPGLHADQEDERPQLGAPCHQCWVLRAAIQAG